MSVRTMRRLARLRTAPLGLTLIVSAFWATTSPAEGPRLAVMDFRAGEGVTAEQARTLTGMLRSALYSTAKFTLINREDIEAIAQNHKIELVFCDDDECLLQIGSLLGAEKLVAGDIGVVVGEFVVNARLVDIRSKALINECVATRRSDPSAAALQFAMEDLATELAGGKVPRRLGSRPTVTEDPFDGSILRLEGESVLLSLRGTARIRPRTLLEVLRPPRLESKGSMADSTFRSLARPIGKLRVVSVTGSQATAYSVSPLTPRILEAGYPVRVFRTRPWLSLEPFIQFSFSKHATKIDVTKDRYVPGAPDNLDSHRNLAGVSSFEGPLVGASLHFSPISWIQPGVRGSIGWIYNGQGNYEYVNYHPAQTLIGHFKKSHEAITFLGPAVRIRRTTSRELDVFFEGEILRIGWGSAVKDQQDIAKVDPPAYLGAARLGVIQHGSSGFGYMISIGMSQTMGGDWSTSAIGLTLAPAFGL